MSELKPCPFCGCSLTDFVPDDGEGYGWAVHPYNRECFMSLWEFDQFDYHKWNRRADQACTENQEA